MWKQGMFVSEITTLHNSDMAKIKKDTQYLELVAILDYSVSSSLKRSLLCDKKNFYEEIANLS